MVSYGAPQGTPLIPPTNGGSEDLENQLQIEIVKLLGMYLADTGRRGTFNQKVVQQKQQIDNKLRLIGREVTAAERLIQKSFYEEGKTLFT